MKKQIDQEELRRNAQQAVLDGLRSGQELHEIEAAVSQSHIRGSFSPDLAMLSLVAAALDVAGANKEQPLSTAGWRERYLPEVTFRNRPKEVERVTYALHAGAAVRTGLQPDVLDDTYHWHADVWPYATLAAVMAIRAVADGGDLAQVCDQIADALRGGGSGI